MAEKIILAGIPVQIECAMNNVVIALLSPGLEITLASGGLEEIGRSTFYTSGRFLGDVSHELFSPWTTVETYESIAKHRCSLNDFIKVAYGLNSRYIKG